MDIARAKEIVEVLAEGIDPITGEILPAEHLCNNAEIVRAFYALLHGNCEKKGKVYENSGKKWTKQEDEQLKLLFEQGIKVEELQKRFMRSRGSIRSRLAKLGFINEAIYFV